MADRSWSQRENDLIVADYFAMLADDVRGHGYSKAEHRRQLLPLLDNRTEGSIEFKHQNISAVLKSLGETWIDGYKPAFNFQSSLVESVVNWFSSNKSWIERVPSQQTEFGLEEAESLWVGPPPTASNQPPPNEAEQASKLAQQFDVAARDERNRALGRAGEELVMEYERALLRNSGRADLSEKVRWISEQNGDGAGYDISSFSLDGRRRLVEVKTTNGWERTPFHISQNELQVADSHRSEWVLFRLWNFSRKPNAFELRPPLDAHVTLTPTSFRANLQ
ncbi:MAG: DUF3883 domain-containing protein [Pseudomonadota bacterium]